MRLLLPSLFLWLYVSFSLLRLLPVSWFSRGLLSLGLLAAAMKYPLYEYLGGSFFAPVLPRTVLLVMEALYAALIILFFLLLCHDLLTLLCALVRRFCLPACRLPLTETSRAAVLLLAALVCGGWSVRQSVTVPDVRTVEITLPRLPRALDGFTIVQLSDIHIRILLNRDWLESVVERANELSPDLIALTGDYIDGSVRQLGHSLEPLRDLKARFGTWGVTGNHELYYGWQEWTEFLEKQGVRMLENEYAALKVNGETLVLAGVPDLAFGRSGETWDAGAAFRGAPDAVRILLCHRPAGAWGHGADLQLSGHTHGGSFFFLKPLLAYFNGGFVRGLYAKDGMRLYVSPGTGIWGGFSCRLGVPSEITRIVLRAQEKN